MPSYPTRKIKSGTVYDVRFRIINDDGSEVQKRLSGYPTKRAAQQAYLDYMKSYAPPSFALNKDTRYTFDELYSLYKKKAETELAQSSFYDLNWIFDKFVNPYFCGKSLPAITKSDYATWQTELWATKKDNGEPYAQKYLNKIRSMFVTFLSWVEETYDIPNLFRQIKKPKRKEVKKEMQIWELDEFLKFQNSIDNEMWKTFFMSLFYSGCRVGELLALSDNDVQLDNGIYSFRIFKNVSRKTVVAGQSFVIASPKTNSSNRSIPLPDIMTDQINRYFEYKKANGISDKFFFGGDAPIPQTTYGRYFQNYTQTAGVKKIRIHDLRHSHASLLIHLNVPITVISKRLGHSSIDMTLKKYAHCYSDSDNVALNAINQAICAANYGTNDGTN